MYFDGSKCDVGYGIGIHIVSPRGAKYQFAVRLKERCTNNQTKYEAIHKGLSLLLEVGADVIEIFGDSKVVLS